METLRCKACGKRLLDTDGRGRIEIVCRHCRTHNALHPPDESVTLKATRDRAGRAPPSA